MINFLWEWDRAKEIYPNWRDGLRAATEIIIKKTDAVWKLNELPDEDADWIITWCDSNSQFSRNVSNYKAKRGIFLTTHPTNWENLLGFDVVFCETSIIYEECRMRGINAIRAFGTDDKFYTPGNKKDIEYFYPATFSPWKRQDKIAHLGNKLLCVGTIQPDGQSEYEACVNNAVITEVGYFPPEKIRDYYHRAKRVIIPAVHGSERTVLEAMSSNILPEVTNPQNRRAYSYIAEFKRSGMIMPRAFIQKYYSAQKYADDILKGLERCK
jgi:hypothetical protein